MDQMQKGLKHTDREQNNRRQGLSSIDVQEAGFHARKQQQLQQQQQQIETNRQKVGHQGHLVEVEEQGEFRNSYYYPIVRARNSFIHFQRDNAAGMRNSYRSEYRNPNPSGRQRLQSFNDMMFHSTEIGDAADHHRRSVISRQNFQSFNNGGQTQNRERLSSFMNPPQFLDNTSNRGNNQISNQQLQLLNDRTQSEMIHTAQRRMRLDSFINPQNNELDFIPSKFRKQSLDYMPFFSQRQREIQGNEIYQEQTSPRKDLIASRRGAQYINQDIKNEQGKTIKVEHSDCDYQIRQENKDEVSSMYGMNQGKNRNVGRHRQMLEVDNTNRDNDDGCNDDADEEQYVNYQNDAGDQYRNDDGDEQTFRRKSKKRRVQNKKQNTGKEYIKQQHFTKGRRQQHLRHGNIPSEYQQIHYPQYQNQQQLESSYNYLPNYYQNQNSYIPQLGYYPQHQQQYPNNYYDEHHLQEYDEYGNYHQEIDESNRFFPQGMSINNEKNRRFKGKNRGNKSKKFISSSTIGGLKSPTRTSKRIAKQKKPTKPSQFTDQFQLSSENPVASDNQRVEQQEQYHQKLKEEYEDYDDVECEEEQEEEQQQQEQEQQEEEQQQFNDSQNNNNNNNNLIQPKISKKKKTAKGNNIIKLKLADNQQSVELITPKKKAKRKGIIGRPKGSKNKKTLQQGSHHLYSSGYQKHKKDDHHLSDNEKGYMRNLSGSSLFTPKSDNGLKFNSGYMPLSNQNDSNNTCQIDGSPLKDKTQNQAYKIPQHKLSNEEFQQHSEYEMNESVVNHQQQQHQTTHYNSKRKLSSGPDGVVFYQLDSGAVTVPLQNLRVQIPLSLLKNRDYPVIIKKRSPQEVKDQNRMIGKLTAKQRKQKIGIYKQKRQRRIWSKKINYDCRKRVADNRLRIKGRFVTKDQAFQILGTTRQDLQNNPQLRKILHNSQNCEIKTDENSIKVRNLQALLENDVKKEDVVEEQEEEDEEDEEEDEDDDEEDGDEDDSDDSKPYDYSYNNKSSERKKINKKIQNSGIDKRLKTKSNSKSKNSSSRMTVTANLKFNPQSQEYDVPDRVNRGGDLAENNKLDQMNMLQQPQKSPEKTHQQLHFEVLSKNADGKVTELKIQNICRRKTSLDADLGSRFNKNIETLAPRFIFVKSQSRKCSMMFEQEENQGIAKALVEKVFRIERPHPRKKVSIRQLNRPSDDLINQLEQINEQTQSMIYRLPNHVFNRIHQFGEPQKTLLFTQQLQNEIQEMNQEINELQIRIKEEQFRQSKRNTAYVIEQHKQKEKRIENSLPLKNKFEIMYETKRQAKREPVMMMMVNPSIKQQQSSLQLQQSPQYSQQQQQQQYSGYIQQWPPRKNVVKFDEKKKKKAVKIHNKKN